jgi:hypothetical protein
MATQEFISTSPAAFGPFSSVPGLDCAGIRFQDEAGNWWCVTEREHPIYPDQRCLVFLSPHAARRVCTYPENWVTLAPAELEALSWKR